MLLCIFFLTFLIFLEPKRTNLTNFSSILSTFESEVDQTFTKIFLITSNPKQTANNEIQFLCTINAGIFSSSCRPRKSIEKILNRCKRGRRERKKRYFSTNWAKKSLFLIRFGKFRKHFFPSAAKKRTNFPTFLSIAKRH